MLEFFANKTKIYQNNLREILYAHSHMNSPYFCVELSAVYETREAIDLVQLLKVISKFENSEHL
jgi:hypothetical protein